jgi:3-oxoacyl-[acyl-carrier-protein] synthase III
MQWNDVYISSSAACLGSTVEDVRDAVADDRYDAEECERDGYLHVRVAGDEPPVDMAVTAANLALDRADVDSDNVVLVIYGGSGPHAGLYYMQAASYVQQQTVGGSATALEVRQASNSGMAGLELAAAYLLTVPTPAAALVTTADKYKLPNWDRYRTDKGQARGDGAAATVLSRGAEGGVAKLLSTASIGDSTHERLYRGDQKWEAYPGANGLPVDFRIRTKEYLQSGAKIEDIVYSVASNQHKVIDAALNDAHIGVDDVARFVYPNTGLTLLNWEARKRESGIDVLKSTWEWGRHIGHMGGSDQVAGLTHLLETHAVHPGDRVVLTGIGGGFTFSAAVVEILQEPDWSNSAN